MVKAFNAQEKTPFTIRFAVPTDFEQVVSRRADHPVIGGELNPVFQGSTARASSSNNGCARMSGSWPAQTRCPH